MGKLKREENPPSFAATEEAISNSSTRRRSKNKGTERMGRGEKKADCQE